MGLSAHGNLLNFQIIKSYHPAVHSSGIFCVSVPLAQSRSFWRAKMFHCAPLLTIIHNRKSRLHQLRKISVLWVSIYFVMFFDLAQDFLKTLLNWTDRWIKIIIM